MGSRFSRSPSPSAASIWRLRRATKDEDYGRPAWSARAELSWTLRYGDGGLAEIPDKNNEGRGGSLPVWSAGGVSNGRSTLLVSSKSDWPWVGRQAPKKTFRYLTEWT